MRKYEVTVNDMMFGNFRGEFEAENIKQAENDAVEFYASEFGADPVEINVLKIKEVK